MHELMVDWLENVWGRCPGALLNLPSMLCLDAFWGHLTDEIKNKIHRLKSELVVIPVGMTSVLQPLDVSVNKPFKARLSEHYGHWILDHDRELTVSGKIKRAPRHVAHWVSSTWTSIPAELVAKSFRKCCISNALDGMEDALLWVDDPSSDYLPSDSDDVGEDEDSSLVLFRCHIQVRLLRLLQFTCALHSRAKCFFLNLEVQNLGAH